MLLFNALTINYFFILNIDFLLMTWYNIYNIREIYMSKIKDPYLAIINTKNKFNPNNSKTFTYEKVDVIAGDWHKDKALLETNTKLAYDKVKAEFDMIGIKCWLISGKRSYLDQIYTQGEAFDIKLKDLAIEKIKEEEKLEDTTKIKLGKKIATIIKNPKHIKTAYQHQKKYVARIGYSEHHSGLAIDIKVNMDNVKIPDKIMERYPNESKGMLNFITRRAILEKHGFIQTYPNSPRLHDVTGIEKPESWHWRYVGAEHSQRIARLREIIGQDVFIEDYVELLNHNIPEGLNDKEILNYQAEILINNISKSKNKDAVTL